MSKLYDQLRNPESLFFLTGPCVVENEQVLEKVALELVRLRDKYHVPIVFKSSFKKANRSRIDSFTGIGDQEAIELLYKVAQRHGLPIITDVHSPADAVFAAQYADILQIPAFLCRQTDLLVASAKTQKIVNIKKGQFLSPEAMQFAVKKVTDSGNECVLQTERGTTFGYRDLVVDMRGFPIMKAHGYPVVMDVTHSLQQPNQSSGVTGGRPALIETLAKSAIAAGADGLFIETHPDPSMALSDGANMLALDKMDDLMSKCIRIKNAL